jgi:quercetin dioxygenase-like cupin family protein
VEDKLIEEEVMKIKEYTAEKATLFDSDIAKGVAARVVIGQKDGAQNFWMRVFEIAPGGYTPRHAHEWEHEMFVHAGSGEIYCQGQWRPLQVGKVLFIPGEEEHQMRDPGQEPLIVVCLVPGSAPEL